MEPNATILHGGRIHTLGDTTSTTDAIRFDGGIVSDVGTTIRERSSDRRIDLDGNVVLPGFHDAHTHVLWVGLYERETDLSGVERRRDVLARLADNAARTEPGEWVLGFGYDESAWNDDTRLRRKELDGVSDQHPIVVQRVDGHTLSLNTQAIDRIDFSGADGVERDASDTPSGIVVEEAAGLVQREIYPDRERARELLDAACDRLHELGVTSVQDMAGLTTPSGTGDPMHAAFQQAQRDGELPLRIGYYIHVERAEELAALELASGFGDDRLRILGVKLFIDGSIGSRTAKLDGEFADDLGNSGEFVIGTDRLQTVLEQASERSQRVAVHAIGDAAIGRILSAFETVADRYETPAPNLRIEHLELATDEQLDRVASLDVLASMQPNFLQWAGDTGLYADRLEQRWHGGTNRLRDIRDRGIDLAFGSDTMPSGPLYGIHHAVNAPTAAQRLEVDEALRAYTHGGAVAEGTDDWKGTLEPGMAADAVVLESDPFDRPETINEISVVATIVDGELVYDDGLT
ncbi:amidohydrolase [Natranaeroarchaeum aerophilus]|uniref:Amidohydrolase n=1 Tax=Natranaeroarchaeum aerophilus TaxID=2917711 RepID=A0AAE3FPW7_9EURY|nr:amidohydrolase [Natranaeroarchaeum aerophilus]MCL9813407.1 amidohydrolase [Natranaeroarchaeum aerophilus]